MEEPKPSQTEITYQTPERKKRVHPLVIFSISLTATLGAILLLHLTTECIKFSSLTCIFAGLIFFANALAMFALGSVNSNSEKWSGATLAIVSLLLAFAQLILLGLWISRNFYSFGLGM